MRITAQARPFICTAGKHSYRLSADEAQRLLDAYTPIQSSPNKITLKVMGVTSVIRPATLGGGPAFVFSADPATDINASKRADTGEERGNQ